MPLPWVVLNASLSEMHTPSRLMLEKCIDEWENHRMTEDDMMNLFRSVSWQSTTLLRFFEDKSD